MKNLCLNHPNTEAISFCHNCGNYYCKVCLNEGKEYYYCNNEDCYKKYIEEGGPLLQKKSKTSSKIFAVVLSIIVMGLVGTIGKQIASNFFKPSEPTIDTQLMKFANEFNKNCPFMVDSETRADNVGVVANTIHYNFTIIDYGVDEIDKELFEELRPPLLNGIKTHPEMKYLRDKRVNFVYNYRDKNGKHMISFKFTPQEYL